MTFSKKRRNILKGSGLLIGKASLGLSAASFSYNISYASSRPVVTHGTQTGDVSEKQAIIWARSDRASKMWVEISDSSDFKSVKILPGPYALPETDFTTKLLVDNLLPGKTVHYRVFFQSLESEKAVSETVSGSFKTAPNIEADIKFVWSGDVAGQGWGINLEEGGMKTWQTMLSHKPDFFIHSGDCIYADGPISEQVSLKDGSIWKNIVTPEVSKVAETTNEFRGRYKYNLLDDNMLKFNASTPIYAQWDDHETRNNWYPYQLLDDKRYSEKNVGVLAARANQAFFEYLPIRPNLVEPNRVYRTIPYGPDLDIFMLDMRSYRGKNSKNDQDKESAETAFFGKDQKEWLKKSLKSSTKTWKIIGSDMPLGLIVPDGDNFENSSNGNGTVRGREFDIAEILRFIKSENIKNIVWLTADVHYTAAHYYNPNKAVFQDFLPFWEFVTGPIHAGTFGPNMLDNTFGPEVVFQKVPTKEQGVNLSPKDGLQFFGVASIKAKNKELTIKLLDRDNNELYVKSLLPVS